LEREHFKISSNSFQIYSAKDFWSKPFVVGFWSESNCVSSSTETYCFYSFAQ